MNRLLHIIWIFWALTPNPHAQYLAIDPRAFDGVEIETFDSINTRGLEFSPCFFEGQLIYISSGSDARIDPTIGEAMFDFKLAREDRFSGNLIPDHPSWLDKLNSDYHEGPASYSDYHKSLFFSRNYRDQPSARGDHLRLYRSKWNGNSWSEAKPLNLVAEGSNLCHPSVSKDGKLLFFASDLPGGYGGMDLYFSINKGQSWSTPVNMGPAINTKGNELFPFIHDSGILFFSSDGHPGLGGLDIFYSQSILGVWSAAEALKEPINSSADDHGFILTPNSLKAFWSSSRKGGKGKDDLYSGRFEYPLVEGSLIPVGIQVEDTTIQSRLSNVNIELIPLRLQGQTNESTQEDQENFLLFELMKKRITLDELVSVTTNTEGYNEFLAFPNTQYIAKLSKSGYKDQYHLMNPVEKSQLLRIYMSSSCSYLTGQVSSSHQQLALPFASLLIKNKETGDSTRYITNPLGSFDICLNPNFHYDIEVEAAFHLPYSGPISVVSGQNLTRNFILKKQGDFPYAKRINEPLRLDKSNVFTGAVLVFNNIYYDYNKSSLKEGATRELDLLADYMVENPGIEIELIAHTDSRGSRDYNLKLSLERAESAKSYLVSKGISKDRVKAFGHGEAQLRNHCRDGIECNETQHEFNRRTEIKILRIRG